MTDQTFGIPSILLWNSQNRMRDISDNGYMSLYWYDADGNRTVKRHNGGDAFHLYLPISRTEEKDNDTAETSENNPQRNHPTTLGDGKVYFYHRDHLGSTMSVTDSLGQVAQTVEYTPTGEVFVEQRYDSICTTPYLFNGKELDEETGLYYYGARYYDPRLSVWYSVDRFAEKYPFLSPYSYGKNNPINFIDINGDTLSWATNINSILVKIKVNKLRLKSTVFNTLYKKLDSHNTVYRIDANNQKVQESFRESSNWREDKAGAYTEGNKIIFSELNATDASFSEEFFHLYQNYLYGNRRTTYEKDAEAKLFNSVVLTEIDNSNYSITGINAIINTINNEFPQSFSYMSGHLITTLESITKTRMQVIKKTDGARLYYDFLKFFEEHHSQTDGDVYNGKQRFLLPNAYNTIIRELK